MAQASRTPRIFRAARSRRRAAALVGVSVAVALALGACGTPGGSPSAPPATVSGDITVWHFFSDREADVIQSAIDKFTAIHPGVHVIVQPGQDDDKMRTAIAAGDPIDVGISYSRDQVGILCSSGAFQDLAPYIARDKLSLADIPPLVQDYSQFEGTRCALPMMADVTALYYNKALFAAAGLTAPPKTLDELSDDAVKLTTYNDDGSIKTLGFAPLTNYYENTLQNMGVSVQAKWLNADDKTSAIGTDPGWVTLLNWQKDLITRLGGYEKVNAWMAGLGDEFSEENDFHTGRVAMMIDGEWRTAFIADQAPKLNYGTAFLPMATGHEAAYGAGGVDGNLIGIPRGAKNPEAAWELIKFLALDTEAQVLMGNGLRNMPTITSAAKSPALEQDANYKTFLEAFANPHSVTIPASVVGTEYLDIFDTFVQGWEAGTETDLSAGLAKVDTDINAAIALGG